MNQMYRIKTKSYVTNKEFLSPFVYNQEMVERKINSIKKSNKVVHSKTTLTPVVAKGFSSFCVYYDNLLGWESCNPFYFDSRIELAEKLWEKGGNKDD